MRGFGGTCCSHLQGGKLRSVTHVLEMRATCACRSWYISFELHGVTTHVTAIFALYIYTHMICVSGGPFCTADILWRPARSCSRCPYVETQDSLHEKRLCLAQQRCPSVQGTHCCPREKKIFSDTILPKERDERLATVVFLTFYSPVITIYTTSLTFTNSPFCPHSCIYVFCVDLRTNSDYFPTQH